MRQQIFYGFHKPRAPKLQNPGGKQDQVDSSWTMCPVHAMLPESRPQACNPQELQPLLPACNKPMLLELSASMLADGFVTLVGCLQWGMHELRFFRTFCVICFLASVGYDALSSALTQPQMHTCWRRGEAQQQHLQKVTWGLALASENLKSPMRETTL